MAAYGAKLAARNAVTGNQYRYDNSSMPSVVFTDPQVASAGLTETTARAQGLDIKVSLLPLDAVPRRSEEHTSELQSLMRISYAVFCLKKKINKKHNTQQ